MAHKYDVSVIIHAVEISSWLKQAVESVLASAEVRPQIVLVLNGQSIAVTPEAVAAEIKEHKWLDNADIKIIRFDQPLGPATAMLEGVAACDSNFIACCDSDSVFFPQKLNLQLQHLRTHSGCALVATRAYRITEDDTTPIKSPAGVDIRKYLLLFNPVIHSSIVMRKSSYKAVGGYNPNLEQMEDYDLILRLAAVGEITILPDRLLKYRIRTNQTGKGVLPRGSHITTITANRKRLAQKLGVNPLLAYAPHLAWRAIQFLCSAKITKPGHEY